MATQVETILNSQADDKATNTATSLGTTATAGAIKGGVTGAGASSGALSAVSAAAPIMALIGMYLSYRGYRDAKKATGTNLTEDEVRSSVDITGARTLIDEQAQNVGGGDILSAGASYVANPALIYTDVAGKLFGSGKHEDQIVRDRWRKNLENIKVAEMGGDGAHYIELADGSLYNIGLDGRAELATYDPNATVDDLGVGKMRPYDIDSSNPLSQQAVGFMNPLNAMMAGGDEKLTSDGTGYMSNAILANAQNIGQAQANARHIYDKVFAQAAQEAGISVEEVALGSLQTLFDMGNITEEQFVAYSNGIRQVYGKAALTQPGTPIEQDPAHVEGIQAADPSQGHANNTATAGVVLDGETDTMGNPTPDTMPTVGDSNDLVPQPQATTQELDTSQPLTDEQVANAQPVERPTFENQPEPDDQTVVEQQQVQQPTAPAATQAPQQQSLTNSTGGGILWKPQSQSDGSLVMLFPYRTEGVTIRDATTGEVIDTGRSTGPSNGYMDTIRFSKPGGAYQNVIVDDGLGNQITVSNGRDRLENLGHSGTQQVAAQGPNLPGQLPTRPLASRDQLGLSSPEPMTRSASNYDEQSALLNQQFQNQMILQDRAAEQADEARRKGMVSSLAMREISGMQPNQSIIPQSNRDRGRSAMSDLNQTILQ